MCYYGEYMHVNFQSYDFSLLLSGKHRLTTEGNKRREQQRDLHLD